jgi:hypothetical protein
MVKNRVRIAIGRCFTNVQRRMRMNKTDAMLTLSNRRVEMLERLHIELIRERNSWRTCATKLMNSYLEALNNAGKNPDEDEAIQVYVELMRHQ